MPKVAYTPEWIPLKEAAGRLSCDRKTVLNLIDRGDLKVRMIRTSRVIRLHRADFEEALNALAIASSA